MMFRDRLDLSSWVLHFVHRRNPENDPAYEINEGEPTPFFPFHEDAAQNERFEMFEMAEEASTLAPDDYAFCVLKKILEDGHIRSGWSFRNNRPTIYGPRSACCLTEMPLYALVDYAKRRASEAVDLYAIGLLRAELFAAGGRPAIYGLSTPHREITRPNRYSFSWPRKLDSNCGISEVEQYRYVAMSLGSEIKIDWGHEREWRWADVKDECSCPGLPIWLKDEPHKFSKVMIVVPTNSEAKQILDKLKELKDSGSHNYGWEYDTAAIDSTYVVSLQDVRETMTDDSIQVIKLENLPASTVKTFVSPAADAIFVKHVKSVLEEAHKAASDAALEYIAKSRKDSSGHILDGCGFANLKLYSPQTKLTTALRKLGELHVIGGAGYFVSNFGRHTHGQQALSVAEAAVEGAKKVMERYFPENDFNLHTRWD